MEDIKRITDNLLKTDNGDLNILGKIIKMALIFIAIMIIKKLIDKIINKTLKNTKRAHLIVNDKRANTLVAILKKIVNYVLIFFGIITVLEMFNIPTASILATAGIGGLAVGFGAQSLVKDIITGFFILLEDQYSVGDYIQTGNYDGIVEELGLRVTKLRAFSGELHIIPNSNIQIVTNKTRGAMRALVKVSIAYEENLDKVISILENLCHNIEESNESIVEGPNVIGVADLGESGVDITIVAKTKPMEQWAVEREIRKRVKETLERENIEIPYPRRVIIGGEEI